VKDSDETVIAVGVVFLMLVAVIVVGLVVALA
jgi:hypothetical protein